MGDQGVSNCEVNIGVFVGSRFVLAYQYFLCFFNLLFVVLLYSAFMISMSDRSHVFLCLDFSFEHYQTSCLRHQISTCL